MGSDIDRVMGGPRGYDTSNDAPDRPEPPAPPTKPGAFAPRRTVWPVVFGNLGIAWFGLGLLGYLFVIGSLFLPGGSFSNYIGPLPWGAWDVFNQVVGLILYFVLIFGSILLLKRKPVGARLMFRWALFSTILIGVSMAISIVRLAVGAPIPGVPAGTGIDVFVVVGLLFGVIFGLSLPLTTLIWMTRRSVRDEIASWTSNSPDN